MLNWSGMLKNKFARQCQELNMKKTVFFTDEFVIAEFKVFRIACLDSNYENHFLV